jgi:voltage-gated potassium channel
MSTDEKNFSWLLVALLVFLVGIPVIEQTGLVSSRMFRALIVSWLLVVGVWSLRGFRRLFPFGLAIAATGVTFSWVGAGSAHAVFQYASFIALLGFLLMAAWCTGSQVARGSAITLNRVTGSICLYLLMGVAWAVAYTLVEMAAAGSFKGFTPSIGQGWDSNWLYFSFVTMSTLGYGDITPVSAIARMLAYLQAVFGLFYIAILVAGLVGAYISNRQNGSSG